VIWQSCGDTCFDLNWLPCNHPLAIVEWKVHRPKHRNVKVSNERAWLRAYCQGQRTIVCYAIEIDGTRTPIKLVCSRFLGNNENKSWLELTLQADEIPPTHASRGSAR
jgi:hypothetical protein